VAGSAAGLAAGSVVGVTAGSAAGSAAGDEAAAPVTAATAATAADGSAVRRRAAWPLFIATSVTSCFKSSSEMSPGARGASPSRARRRRQCTRTARAWRGGLRHVHEHAHAHCDVWAGAAWADLLYCLLYISLYRKLLYIRPKIAV
jgi:hypothetical protein